MGSYLSGLAEVAVALVAALKHAPLLDLLSLPTIIRVPVHNGSHKAVHNASQLSFLIVKLLQLAIAAEVRPLWPCAVAWLWSWACFRAELGPLRL